MNDDKPTVEYLRECLVLDDSTYSGLRWREDRPASHFKARGRSSGWYTRFAGKPAGTMLSTGIWIVRLMGRNYTAKQIKHSLLTGDPLGVRLKESEREKENRKQATYDWM